MLTEYVRGSGLRAKGYANDVSFWKSLSGLTTSGLTANDHMAAYFSSQGYSGDLKDQFITWAKTLGGSGNYRDSVRSYFK